MVEVVINALQFAHIEVTSHVLRTEFNLLHSNSGFKQDTYHERLKVNTGEFVKSCDG